jgi:hypothetical protein
MKCEYAVVAAGNGRQSRTKSPITIKRPADNNCADEYPK